MDAAEARGSLLELFVVDPDRDITPEDLEAARDWPRNDMIDHMVKARAVELEEGLVAVTLNNLVPAMREMASSGAVIEGIAVAERDGELTLTAGTDPVFSVYLTRGDDDPATEIAVIRSSRDPMFSSDLAVGRVFTVRGRNCASGRLDSGRAADFLLFCEAVRPVVAVPHEPRHDLFIRNRFDLDGSEAAVALTEADGGVPGENWRSVLTTQRATHQRLMMPIWADGIARVHDGLMGLGFRWGEKYLAFNDTDLRTFAIPFEGGAAVFFENIDLCDLHTGLVAVVRTDGDGGIAAFEIHPMDREKDSPSAFVESLVAGACDSVPAMEMDLRTGSLGRTDLLNRHQVAHTVASAIGNCSHVIASIRNGREFDDGMEERTHFDDLEPWDRNRNEDGPTL